MLVILFIVYIDFMNHFSLIKGQLFWEGHKILPNLPHDLDINLVHVRTMRKILQIFVTFSEKLNFNNKIKDLLSLNISFQF